VLQPVATVEQAREITVNFFPRAILVTAMQAAFPDSLPYELPVVTFRHFPFSFIMANCTINW